MSILYFAVKGNIAPLFDLESRDRLALYPFRGHLIRDHDGNAVNLHGEKKLAYFVCKHSDYFNQPSEISHSLPL